MCQGAYGCYGADLIRALASNRYIGCYGYYSCAYALIEHSYGVYCTGDHSCFKSTIANVPGVYVWGYLAAYDTTITSEGLVTGTTMRVYFYGQTSGYASNLICYDADHTCYLYCDGNGCYNAQINSTLGRGTWIVSCDEDGNIDCPNGYISPTSAPTGGALEDVYCRNSYQCTYGELYGDSIYCQGYIACAFSDMYISDSGSIYCDSYVACAYTTISGSNGNRNIYGYGRNSLQNAEIQQENGTINIYLYGTLAGDGLDIYCRFGAVCNIFCESNGCSNSNIQECSGQCNIDCDESGGVSCPNGYIEPTSSPTQFPSGEPTDMNINTDIITTTDTSNGGSTASASTTARGDTNGNGENNNNSNNNSDESCDCETDDDDELTSSDTSLSILLKMNNEIAFIVLFLLAFCLFLLIIIIVMCIRMNRKNKSIEKMRKLLNGTSITNTINNRSKKMNEDNNDTDDDDEDSLLGVDLQATGSVTTAGAVNNNMGRSGPVLSLSQSSPHSPATGVAALPGLTNVPSASLSSIYRNNEKSSIAPAGVPMIMPQNSSHGDVNVIHGDVITPGGLPMPSETAMKRAAPPAPPAPMPPVPPNDIGKINYIDDEAAIQLAMQNDRQLQQQQHQQQQPQKLQLQQQQRSRAGEKSGRLLAGVDSEYAGHEGHEDQNYNETRI